LKTNYRKLLNHSAASSLTQRKQRTQRTQRTQGACVNSYVRKRLGCDVSVACWSRALQY